MSELQMTAPVPLSDIEQMGQKIEELKSALMQNLPHYDIMLQKIHIALHKDQALTHMLSDEQVGIIVMGLAKKANIVIAEAETKKKGKTSSGKSLKNIDISEL